MRSSSATVSGEAAKRVRADVRAGDRQADLLAHGCDDLRVVAVEARELDALVAECADLADRGEQVDRGQRPERVELQRDPG